MKVVNQELGYIDYTIGNKGIRVRRETFRAIKGFAGISWSEFGKIEQIPMTPASLSLAPEYPELLVPLQRALKSMSGLAITTQAKAIRYRARKLT